MAGPGGDKPRLSELQKKQNHIESEKKRREAIRRGFDQLAGIVPGMQGSGRSEAPLLAATVDYLREQIKRKEELRKMARQKGMDDKQFEEAYTSAKEAADEAAAWSPEESTSSGRASSSGTVRPKS